MFSRRSVSAFATPFAAVWSGEYDRAAAELHNDTRPGAAVMRARVYGNLHLEHRVLAEYETGAWAGLDRVESALYRAVVASALHVTRDHRAARSLSGAVERDVSRLHDPLLRLTVAYYRAIGEYAAGEQGTAERVVEATLAELDSLPTAVYVPREPYRFEGNHLRARLLQMRSIGCYMRDDYAGEERALIDAVLASELVHQRDLVHESNLLASLAKMFLRYPSLRARELVYVKARELRFSAHLDHRLAAIKAALIANRAIFGSSIDADILSGRSAPALPYRLSACIGTLLYARWSSVHAYREALAFALSVARAIDWNQPADDEANRLLTFAAIIAPHDAVAADEMLASFRCALAKYSPFLVSYRDPRRAVLERFARACIAKARGDLDDARAKFAEANAFWRARGFLVAAAFGGVEAFAVTADPEDLAPARAFVATYPQSDFSTRLCAALNACANATVPRFPYLASGCAVAAE